MKKIQCYKTRHGFYELRPRPSLKTLQSYYASKYYQEGRGSYEVRYGAEELQWIKRKSDFREYLAKKFLSPKAPKNPSVLDVGCGEGFVMNAFLKKGWEVEGIDFSCEGLKQKNPHLLRYFIKGDLETEVEKKIISGTSYDCILLVNVLEHVLQPIKIIKKLKKIVRKNGIMLVTVPNDFSTIQLIAETKKLINRRFWLAPPDHLQYFNTDSLAKTVEACQWRELATVSDFPIDWFLYHRGSNYIANQKNGKPAHNARILIEQIILENDFEKVFEFSKSLAGLKMGRDITGIFRN